MPHSHGIVPIAPHTLTTLPCKMKSPEVDFFLSTFVACAWHLFDTQKWCQHYYLREHVLKFSIILSPPQLQPVKMVEPGSSSIFLKEFILFFPLFSMCPLIQRAPKLASSPSNVHLKRMDSLSCFRDHPKESYVFWILSFIFFCCVHTAGYKEHTDISIFKAGSLPQQPAVL